MKRIKAILDTWYQNKFNDRTCEMKHAILIAVFIIVVIGLVYLFYYAYDHLTKNKNSFSSPREMFSNMCGGSPHYTFVRSEGFANVKVGANSYKIHEDLDNPYKAAEMMDKLNDTATTLIAHLTKRYLNDSDGINIIKPEYRNIVIKGIKSLKKNFKSANMEENIPERSGGDTSYVIDKGDVFAMCLRDPRKNNQLDDNYNSLTFVLVHELSHIFCSEWGHTDLFWNNFKFLLQEAVEIGIYTSVDYKRVGSPYCGIVISYSPLFDKRLHEYKIEQPHN